MDVAEDGGCYFCLVHKNIDFDIMRSLHIYINCGYVGNKSAQVRYVHQNNVTANYPATCLLLDSEAGCQVAMM